VIQVGDRRLRTLHVLSLGVAVVATLTSAVSGLALAVGVVGTTLVAAGLWRRAREWIALGGVVLFTGSVLVAAAGADAITVLVAAFGGVLAYDFGEFIVDLETTVGPETPTLRVEALHAVASVLVALVVATVGLVVYQSTGGGQSLGVVALLLAAVLLASQLRPRDDPSDPGRSPEA
jgi:hypothetical protein